MDTNSNLSSKCMKYLQSNRLQSKEGKFLVKAMLFKVLIACIDMFHDFITIISVALQTQRKNQQKWK